MKFFITAFLLCLFLNSSWSRCPPGKECRYESIDGKDFSRLAPGIPVWFCSDLYDLCREGNLFTHDFCMGKYLCCGEAKRAFQRCAKRGYNLWNCHTRNWINRVSQMCYWSASDADIYRTGRRRRRFY